MDIAALARSFRRVGSTYEQYRPGYPSQVADLLAPEPLDAALDLAAGTGKFTGHLLARARRVTAIDPSAAMLAELRVRFPQVVALEATAESLPLATDSQDLVTVAQAFHWFDREAAVAEIVRVLRPGGTLGLIWNGPDHSCGWDVAAHAVAHPHTAEIDRPEPDRGLPGLDLVGVESVPWVETITRERYLRRWLTVSSFIAADEDSRLEMLGRIEHLLDTHPDAAGRAELQLPQITEVVSYRAPG